MANEARPNFDGTSGSRADAIFDTVGETAAREEENAFTVEKAVGKDKRPTSTHYTVCWNGYRLQRDTGKPAEHIPDQLQEAYWRSLREGQQKTKSTMRKKRLTGNGGLLTKRQDK